MKLLALDITNLTDARYFAAMGASYICFDPQHTTIEQISAMIPWLDVPGFMLQYLDKAELDDIWEHSQKSGINSIVLGHINRDVLHESVELNQTDLIEKPDEISGMSSGNRLLFSLESLNGDMEKTLDLISPSEGAEVFIEVSPKFQPDAQLLQRLDINGIFVRGGEEEKTGLKSFEDLDKTLEYYQDVIALV